MDGLMADLETGWEAVQMVHAIGNPPEILQNES